MVTIMQELNLPNSPIKEHEDLEYTEEKHSQQDARVSSKLAVK